MPPRATLVLVSGALAALLAAGCSDSATSLSTSAVDGGGGRDAAAARDAAAPDATRDAGVGLPGPDASVDAALPGADAEAGIDAEASMDASVAPDAEGWDAEPPPEADAGVEPDAGVESGPDAGPAQPDAGFAGGVDAGPPPITTGEVHPILLFTEADLPRLRAQLSREPYRSLWGWVQAQADAHLLTDWSAVSAEVWKSERAKALAMAYAMTGDTKYAEAGTRALRAIVPKQAGGDWADIHTEVDAVANYAHAYDTLYGYLQGNPGVAAEVRERVVNMGQRMRTYSEIWYLAFQNNWQIRQYSALGLVAIAVYGHSEAPGWYSFALQEVQRGFSYQFLDEGGCAEGPNYHWYSENIYLPYLLALRRFSHVDLFQLPAVRRTHEWSVKIRMPDGRRPNTDDSSFVFSYGLSLAAAHRDGVYRWDWETASEPFLNGFAIVDVLATFDDAIPATPPSWSPTQLMASSGDAVFRSDWSPQAVYLVGRAEHGKARANAHGHGHPDATSFGLYAFGEYLALDSGYINFPNHHKVNKAKNHNLILVDGVGPPLQELFGTIIEAGVDAWLENPLISAAHDWAEVRTAYAGVDLRRSFLFADHRYFVIADEVSATAPHTYDWLLHGNGGGTSGGTFLQTSSGAEWTHGNARLVAHVDTTAGGPTLTSADDIHSFFYGQELTHTVLHASRTASGNVGFLAVLYPQPAGATPASLTSLDAGGGISAVWIVDASEQRRDLAYTGLGSGFVSLPGVPTSGRMAQIDAKTALLGFRPDGSWRSVFAKAVTGLVLGERIVFASTETVDLSLKDEGGRLFGQVRGPPTRLRLARDEAPNGVLGALDHRYANQFLELDLASGAAFEVW